MWKIQHFSVHQILREINLGECTSSKIAVFVIIGALYFVHLVNFSLQKVQKFRKSKIKNPKLISRKNWRKMIYELSTLCNTQSQGRCSNQNFLVKCSNYHKKIVKSNCTFWSEVLFTERFVKLCFATCSNFNFTEKWWNDIMQLDQKNSWNCALQLAPIHRVTVRKNEKILTEKKFRQINYLVISLVKPLLSLIFCQNCVRVNFRNFHTVQCGNCRIFLSLRFYVKSILENLEVLEFCNFRGSELC